MARRYAAARPDVHSDVVAYLRRALGSDASPMAVLDVGCGTGLSTRPLRALSSRVLGIDPSEAMLTEALRAGGASYIRGRAEALPFSESSLDLVTIGCAYHWCDPDAFLEEVLRTLSPGGALALYDSFFLADRPESGEVFDWLTSEFWSQLPRTPRNPLPEIGEFSDPRFRLVASTVLNQSVRMSYETLALYLTTQSGAVAAVESGERTLSDLHAVLEAGLEPLVPPSGQTVDFAGPIWVVRPSTP